MVFFSLLGAFFIIAFLLYGLDTSGRLEPLHIDSMLSKAGLLSSAQNTTSNDGTSKVLSKAPAQPHKKAVTLTQQPTAAPYTSTSRIGDYVIVQVSSIEPSIGIGTMEGAYTDIACKCKSPSGGTYWVYMSISDYIKNIDPSAKLTDSAHTSFKTITYPGAVKMYGHIRNADSMCPGLAASISSKQIVEFRSVEIQSTAVFPTKEPAKVYLCNGTMLISPEYNCVCPFTIVADSNTDYYVYLKYQKVPWTTTESRTTKPDASILYESDIAFYVKAGSEASVQIPINIYKLYYATGRDFYGTTLLFGENTQCYSSHELLSFYSDNQYYNGHTITLKSTYNGNF